MAQSPTEKAIGAYHLRNGDLPLKDFRDANDRGRPSNKFPRTVNRGTRPNVARLHILETTTSTRAPPT